MDLEALDIRNRDKTIVDDEPWQLGSRAPGLRLGPTHVGQGVFATHAFPADAILGEVLGQRIDDPEYDSAYCIDTEDGRSLEPEAPFRFLNHHCEPNCQFDFLDMSDEQIDPLVTRVFVIALRDIEGGEELTIDYNWPADAAIPCHCRAASCRGWIVDAAELPALSATQVPDLKE